MDHFWKDNSNPGIVCIYKQIELLHSTGVPKLTPEYGVATTTILNVGNKLVTDFKERDRLFNKYFGSKSIPITNDSSLSSLLNLNSTFLLTSNFSINFINDFICNKAILEKSLKKNMFNNIFEYLQENYLLCENQSGFRPSDSSEYQLLSIVHAI